MRTVLIERTVVYHCPKIALTIRYFNHQSLILSDKYKPFPQKRLELHFYTEGVSIICFSIENA